MKNFKVMAKGSQRERLYIRRLKKLDKDGYYKLIAEEMDKGGRQFIITNDIMIDVILKYVLDFKYNLVNVEVDSQVNNVALMDYIHKMKNEQGYLAYVLDILKNEMYINSITLEKYEETITIKSNGIISTNTIVSRNMLDVILNSYLN